MKRQYFYTFGKKLDLKNPHNLNEKLIWLSLYWRHPLKSYCADKVKVRDYVKEKGLECILTPILGIYNTPDEIPFSQLPKSFVLKCNHGCGYNIIVFNKDDIDKKVINGQLEAWLQETYGEGTIEIHYRDISQHLIICEKNLCENGQKELIDYKVHCINGEPQYIQVCYDRDERGVAHRASYSLNWEPLHYFTEPECEVDRPKSLNKMIEYSAVLSKDFPYVRVDFYDIDGEPILSELTFTPFGNMIYWVKDSVMDELGEELILPKKYLPF